MGLTRLNTELQRYVSAEHILRPRYSNKHNQRRGVWADNVFYSQSVSVNTDEEKPCHQFTFLPAQFSIVTKLLSVMDEQLGRSSGQHDAKNLKCV
jgi:hypothetical protein